jgi:hypothetical protein
MKEGSEKSGGMDRHAAPPIRWLFGPPPLQSLGAMAERLKASDLKSDRLARVSGVRIPLAPLPKNPAAQAAGQATSGSRFNLGGREAI